MDWHSKQARENKINGLASKKPGKMDWHIKQTREMGGPAYKTNQGWTSIKKKHESIGGQSYRLID